MKTTCCFLTTLACFHLPLHLLMSLGISPFLFRPYCLAPEPPHAASLNSYCLVACSGSNTQPLFLGTTDGLPLVDYLKMKSSPTLGRDHLLLGHLLFVAGSHCKQKSFISIGIHTLWLWTAASSCKGCWTVLVRLLMQMVSTLLCQPHIHPLLLLDCLVASLCHLLSPSMLSLSYPVSRMLAGTAVESFMVS